jgi:hypothetical protein
VAAEDELVKVVENLFGNRTGARGASSSKADTGETTMVNYISMLFFVLFGIVGWFWPSDYPLRTRWPPASSALCGF